MNSNQICQHRAPCTGEPLASTKGMFVRALHVVFPIPFFISAPFFLFAVKIPLCLVYFGAKHTSVHKLLERSSK